MSTSPFSKDFTFDAFLGPVLTAREQKEAETALVAADITKLATWVEDTIRFDMRDGAKYSDAHRTFWVRDYRTKAREAVFKDLARRFPGRVFERVIGSGEPILKHKWKWQVITDTVLGEEKYAICLTKDIIAPGQFLIVDSSSDEDEDEDE